MSPKDPQHPGLFMCNGHSVHYHPVAVSETTVATMLYAYYVVAAKSQFARSPIPNEDYTAL